MKDNKQTNLQYLIIMGFCVFPYNRQTKDSQTRLLLLKQSVKSSRTSSRCIVEKTPTSQGFVESLNIPPAVIQKFSESEDVIGEGRYGTCTKVLIHGIVACAKSLKVSSRSSMSAIAHEATILSRVRHPHICFLIGIQVTKEPFQLITSLYSIEGVSITVYDTFSMNTVGVKKHVIKSLHPSLTLQVWLFLMKNLAEALQFIHSKGIVDRDLKSDNVVLTKLGDSTRGILVDFGKSNYVDKVSRYKLSEKEKQQYRQDHKHIAPDLVDGVSDITTACDMYSYGHLFKSIIQYFPLAIESIEISLQKDIKKCLKYDCMQRPSAKQMVELLNSTLDS